MAQKLWEPRPELVHSSAMGQLIKSKGFQSYDELFQWSVHHWEDFWRLWLERSGMIYEGSHDPTVEKNVLPFAPFFPNLSLNFAENLLRLSEKSSSRILSLSESRPPMELSYQDLFKRTTQFRQGLDELGVTSDSVVAGFIPNCVEAIVSMLGTTSRGAAWSSCSPDFGVQGVLDRFGQIKPSVLVAANAYIYNGKVHDCMEKLALITQAIPEIKMVVVIPFVPNHPTTHPTLKTPSVLWDQFGIPSAWITYERVPFNHPAYIMFSSGTTGVPKCIVHGVGGTLLQHTKELCLHSDLKIEDHISYFTTCGWMMWNWLISSLFTGASLTVYDGSPSYPSLDFLWDLVETEKLTHFGTSPKFLGACRVANLRPNAKRRFENLRVVLSTGSPLLEEDFDWVYKNVKSDLQLSSISGGTDIISCFMLGSPTLPVYRGEIQCIGLGMDVAAFQDGQAVPLGSRGELVCRKPFPSAPVFFWNDPERTKYLKAYYHTDPSTWYHGDFIELTGSQGGAGGIKVYGRSDTTLNPGGVRIGTAEIYRLVETIPAIEDSIVVGLPKNGDVSVVLFVKLRSGQTWSSELEKVIRTSIRNGATPRHVPEVIRPVEKIPYTISGKKVELAVLEILQGREPKNKDALIDRSALDCYRNFHS